MRRRVKAVAPAEASMRSEHARREDVPAKNQTKEVVAHELKVGGVWKEVSWDFLSSALHRTAFQSEGAIFILGLFVFEDIS